MKPLAYILIGISALGFLALIATAGCEPAPIKLEVQHKHEVQMKFPKIQIEPGPARLTIGRETTPDQTARPLFRGK